MIEYDLVQKEADPLNMNLIDLVCPQQRCCCALQISIHLHKPQSAGYPGTYLEL
jgi:hypothetical protein